MDNTGKISIQLLSRPTPLPLDPNDPVIRSYLSIDDAGICRFYGDRTYVFKSLVHPSGSSGRLGNMGNGRYNGVFGNSPPVNNFLALRGKQ